MQACRQAKLWQPCKAYELASTTGACAAENDTLATRCPTAKFAGEQVWYAPNRRKSSFSVTLPGWLVLAALLIARPLQAAL